jgi:hypothetical protein
MRMIAPFELLSQFQMIDNDELFGENLIQRLI